MIEQMTDEQVYQMTDDELLQYVAGVFYRQRLKYQAEQGTDVQIALSGRLGNLLQSGLGGIMKSRALEFDQAMKEEDYRRVAAIIKEIAGPKYTAEATALLYAMTGRTR